MPRKPSKPKSPALPSKSRAPEPLLGDGEMVEKIVTPAKVLGRIRGWILGDMARVELRHMTGDATTTRVRQWKLDGEEGTNAEVLAYEITKTAEDDADGMGGVQRYAVYAYESVEPGIPHASRVLFSIRADGEGATDEAGPSEPATEKGLTAQLMRHVESNNRMIASMFADTVGIQHQAIQTLTARLEKYEEKRYEQFELTEKLASAQHARDLATLREERMNNLTEKGINKAVELLPILLARLGTSNKAKALPAKKAKGAAEMKALFDGMPQEKLAGLANVLGMSRLAIVGEIANALKNETADATGTELLIKTFVEGLDEETLKGIEGVLSPVELGAFLGVCKLYMPAGASEAAQ